MPNRRRRQMTKKKTAAVRILMSCILLAQVTDLRARSFDARSGLTKWPTHGWAKGKSSSVGLDEKILAELDGDLASGKYSLVDSFAVFRCGTSVYERTYSHDYHGARLERRSCVRRSQERFEPDGGDRRLGAVRDRPADGPGARKGFQLQQRRVGIAGLHFPEGDGAGR